MWCTGGAYTGVIVWPFMAGCEGPLGELTCNQCSTMKDDKLLHTNPDFACGYTAQVPSAVSGTVWRKSIGANST